MNTSATWYTILSINIYSYFIFGIFIGLSALFIWITVCVDIDFVNNSKELLIKSTSTIIVQRVLLATADQMPPAKSVTHLGLDFIKFSHECFYYTFFYIFYDIGVNK